MPFSLFKKKKETEEVTESTEKNKKTKKTKKETSKKDTDNINIFKKNKVLDIIAPGGINPNPLDHMVINNTINVYTRTFYVQSIPTRARFAYTFSNLFKYPNSQVAVYIDPIPTGKAISDLDKDIVALDVERLEAAGKDRNRERKISKKLIEAEELSNTIDSGENQLSNIAILITLYSKSLEQLDKMSVDFRNIAKNTGITLTACFQQHDEAFKACTPSATPSSLKKLKLKDCWHLVDKYSLATLFHYTQSDFSHKKGSWLGTNVQTQRNVFYYLFDESLNAYNAVICGISGSGKSTLLKKIAMDHIEMGCKFVCLDTDSATDRGEFSNLADSVNGIDIAIHADSKTILNPFDLDIEYKHEPVTGREIPTLDLTSKILDATYILLTMARGNDGSSSVNEMTKQIIQDVIALEYAELEIYNGKPDSLYTTGRVLDGGRLTSGKVRKEMPTLTSWYNRLEEMAKKNTNATYAYHYDYLTMVMKDWVRGKGTRPYFDGQSTFKFDTSVPFINVDIHKLHETFEKPVAQIIVLSKFWEDYFKKNSENTGKAEELIGIFDEVHLLLRFPEARMFLVNFYKRLRKKNAGVITSTQEIVEFEKYQDTMAIITNAETKIIGKQDDRLVESVQRILNLTDSEAYATATFPEKGMYLVKSKNRKVFVKSHILDIERLAVETNRKIIDQLKAAR